MGDPRSKPKTAKNKENKAPHSVIQQNQAAKGMANMAPPQQKIMRNTGRGR